MGIRRVEVGSSYVCNVESLGLWDFIGRSVSMGGSWGRFFGGGNFIGEILNIGFSFFIL